LEEEAVVGARLAGLGASGYVVLSAATDRDHVHAKGPSWRTTRRAGAIRMSARNDQREVTRLLLVWTDGDRDALDQLFPIVYDELRRIARRRLRNERPGHTLGTTALVHEAYLKLVNLDQIPYQGRAHFFAVAAKAMRHILVNYAIRRKAQKRGGGQPVRTLDEVNVMAPEYAAELLSLDEALKRLEAINERLGRVVEYRFFAGMTIEETADVLAVSPATIKRDWTMARAWLLRELSE
jgi:RNA polymerase sigma factor (TIGR02999 family)